MAFIVDLYNRIVSPPIFFPREGALALRAYALKLSGEQNAHIQNIIKMIPAEPHPRDLYIEINGYDFYGFFKNLRPQDIDQGGAELTAFAAQLVTKDDLLYRTQILAQLLLLVSQATRGSDLTYRANLVENIIPCHRVMRNQVYLSACGAQGKGNANVLEKLPPAKKNITEMFETASSRCESKVLSFLLSQNRAPRALLIHRICEAVAQDPLLIEEAKKCIELLKEHYDMNDSNCNGQTPMHVLATSKYNITEFLNFMVDQGADPLIQDAEERTPLHVAVANLNLTTIQVMLFWDLNPNEPDNRGYTPLFYLIYAQRKKQGMEIGMEPMGGSLFGTDDRVNIANCLIRGGALVEYGDHENNTLFHHLIAKPEEDFDLFNVLYKNVKDKQQFVTYRDPKTKQTLAEIAAYSNKENYAALWNGDQEEEEEVISFSGTGDVS